LELTKEQASRLVYTFGPFQLEPAEHRLVRDGRDVRLPLKVFETLVVLVERHGLLVEKDDLMKALWPGMFVEEATLAGNISLLRKALGDAPGPEESQYIETVTKRGYRFIAKVTEVNPTAESSVGVEDAGVASVVAAPSGPQQNGLVGGAFLEHFKALRSGVVRERVAWATAAIAVIGALLAIGFGFTRVRRSTPEAATVRSTILPPTDHQFRISVAEQVGMSVNASAPAISPDGRFLVVPVRDSQGRMVLWVRSLNTGEGKILQGTEGGTDPFWSPDGRSIGFFADGKLNRIHSDGSSLKTLCDAVGGRGGAWSSNSKAAPH
jgi:DNA-binding winged helix-turn-helix (wHTH) protein